MLKNTFSKQDYEIIEKTILHQSVFCLTQYKIRHCLFNGGTSDTVERTVLERKSAAAVLLFDPILEKVILIEQFRPGPLSHSDNPWLFEIVAGVIEPNEKPDEVAIREAVEEAGCTVLDLIPMCDYYVSPGGSNEYLHIYLGKVDASHASGIHGLADEHEDIRVVCISLDQAFAEMRENRIKTAPAVVALLWLELHLMEVKKLWIVTP